MSKGLGALYLGARQDGLAGWWLEAVSHVCHGLTPLQIPFIVCVLG